MISNETPSVVFYLIGAFLYQHQYSHGTALYGVDIMQIIHRELDCTIKKKRHYSRSYHLSTLKLLFLHIQKVDH